MEDFFSIMSKSGETGSYTYRVMINAGHRVFGGHFPGNPIVPGVMTMMMVRMCAEDAAGLGATRYSAVKEAKYYQPIRPDGKPIVITMSIDESLNVKADVATEEGVTMTKVRGTLTQAE